MCVIGTHTIQSDKHLKTARFFQRGHSQQNQFESIRDSHHGYSVRVTSRERLGFVGFNFSIGDPTLWANTF
jgi:hypothetical protein